MTYEAVTTCQTSVVAGGQCERIGSEYGSYIA